MEGEGGIRVSIGKGGGEGGGQKDGEQRYMKAKLALHRLNSPQRLHVVYRGSIASSCTPRNNTFSSSFFFLLSSSFFLFLLTVTREVTSNDFQTRFPFRNPAARSQFPSFTSDKTVAIVGDINGVISRPPLSSRFERRKILCLWTKWEREGGRIVSPRDRYTIGRDGGRVPMRVTDSKIVELVLVGEKRGW